MFTVSDCRVNKGEAPASDLKGAKSNKRGPRYRTKSHGKRRKWNSVRMKQTLNKNSSENKTDPLQGSATLSEEDKEGDKGARGRTTFGEMFSYPCLQCAVLIIPLFPWGVWRTHSDILVNILRSKRTSLGGEGQTQRLRKENSTPRFWTKLFKLQFTVRAETCNYIG